MESKNNLRIQVEQLFRDNPGKSFGVSEIARQFNARRNTIHYHLKTLKARNFLGQNSEGEYYLAASQENHDPNEKDLTLGKRFKHVYTAFLVSNFVPVVQAWLGNEYSKLSNDLGELGGQSGSNDASQAARLFKTASKLTFALFTCVIVYLVLFVLSRMYSVLSKVFYNYALSPSIVILIAILVCGNNIILRKAWINISKSFMVRGENSSSMRAATIKVARVIEGVNLCIVSWVMFVISFLALDTISFIYGISFIFDILQNLASLVLFLAIGFSALLSMILGLIGIVNQAIGIFGLFKALKSNT